eukprot:1858775-Prymnesium_polylepis.1
MRLAALHAAVATTADRILGASGVDERVPIEPKPLLAAARVQLEPRDRVEAKLWVEFGELALVVGWIRPEPVVVALGLV